MSLVYSAVIPLARTLLAAQGARITVTGQEHVPVEGPAVITANHISYLDYVYAGLAVRHRRRLVRFMAKKELFDQPVLGAALRDMGHIRVDREAGAAAYQEAVKALREGELVGVYPEATISRSWELKTFKTGAARMAAASGAPLLPIVTWGPHTQWTKGLPKRMGRTNPRVAIHVGAPIPVAPDADAQATTDVLHARMTELLHAAQAEHGPMPPELSAWESARLGGTAPTLEEADALDAAERRERRRRHLEKLKQQRERG